MVKYIHQIRGGENAMGFLYSKLRGRIVEVYGSQKEFSKNIGLSEQSITAKLNGRSDFSQDDIIRWSNALQIGLCDIGTYFFNQELSKW